TMYDTTSGLPDDAVVRLLETAEPDGSRTLWVGTRGGLVRRARDEWTVYDRSSGLPHAAVSSLLETADIDGRALWVGTYGGGLARVGVGRPAPCAARAGVGRRRGGAGAGGGGGGRAAARRRRPVRGGGGDPLRPAVGTAEEGGRDSSRASGNRKRLISIPGG